MFQEIHSWDEIIWQRLERYVEVPLSGLFLLLFVVISNEKYKNCGQTREMAERTLGLEAEALVQILITCCVVLSR